MKAEENAYERVYGFMLGVLAAGVVFGAMALFVFLSTSTPRSSEATHYDLDCVTEPRTNPLEECKDGAE